MSRRLAPPPKPRLSTKPVSNMVIDPDEAPNEFIVAPHVARELGADVPPDARDPIQFTFNEATQRYEWEEVGAE